MIVGLQNGRVRVYRSISATAYSSSAESDINYGAEVIQLAVRRDTLKYIVGCSDGETFASPSTTRIYKAEYWQPTKSVCYSPTN